MEKKFLNVLRKSMDKIDKFLNKLSKAESSLLMKVITDVLKRKTDHYDVKKLKGHTDVYRIRVGNKRIIYRQIVGDIEILDVSLRSEKTYREY